MAQQQQLQVFHTLMTVHCKSALYRQAHRHIVLCVAFVSSLLTIEASEAARHQLLLLGLNIVAQMPLKYAAFL